MATETKKPLTITQLQVRGVKRIRVALIRPDGSLVKITGKNAQGKSSLLDAIAMGLAGKGAMPPDPVRHGDREGEINIDLGDPELRYKVRRRIDEDGKTVLEVTGADGVPCPGPQTLLDSFQGRLTFDPIAFARLPAKDQAEQLRRLADLNFTEIDGRRAKAYADRTLVNRQHDNARAKLRGATAPTAGLPEKLLVVQELMGELMRAQRQVRENFDQRHQVDDLRNDRKQVDKDIRDLEQELADARKKAGELDKAIETFAAAADKLVDPDVEALEAKVLNAEKTNTQIRARDNYMALDAEVRSFSDTSDKLSEAIEAIDREKADRIKAAPMPIEGLGFDDNGVTYKGVPFDQASSAERLRVSMAIALASNPTLKVVLVRNGNDLDSEGLQLLAEMARDAGAQLWLERVSDGEDADGAIVIEDGMVKAEPAHA